MAPTRVASGLLLLLTAPLLVACPTGEVDDGTFSFTSLPMDSFGDGDGDTGTTETGSDDATGDGEPGDGDGDPVSESCGDGVVDEGEECDLGDQNSDTGQCTTNCYIATCGDGLVYEGFEECDDGNNVNTDDCVEGCSLATCGDGFTHMGVEMCDDGNDDETDGCTTECIPANCGDGIIQEGEQCDDANRITTDECPACQLAFCGDGFIEAGTEICDDGNMDDTDDCISQLCVPAACGDGHIWAGMETCDDGNMDDTDACPACDPATCGDGFVWEGMEECDDGNNDDDDACTNACTSNARFVFASSANHDGNFGGLDGADDFCQMLADAANLPGTYKAWLSDDTGSPSTRFVQSDTPYQLVDGTVVANNWADLTDGTLQAAINLDENGAAPSPGYVGICGVTQSVWSNTTTSGTLGSANSDCGNWTGSGGSRWGQHTSAAQTWTQWCSGGACNGSWVTSVYCFQQ